MKKMLLFVLALLAVTILSGCSSETPLPQKIEVVLDDVPYPTEKYLRIGYTLKTWEYEKENLELQKIIVLDDESKAELLVIEKANIPLMYKDPLPPMYNLYTGKLTRYYTSIQLPIPLGQAPPRSVSYRLVFNNKDSGSELTVEGAQFTSQTKGTPLVVASPLKGKNLRYFNQSTIGYHFNVLFFNNGAPFNSARYAFDSLQYSDNMAAYYQGDPNQNSSFFNYGKTRCFEPFSLPACDEAQTALIRERAELLDAHRKRQQALHPDLGLTDMYNVREKLRSGETLTAKERTIHDKGLVAVLRQLHDDLDAAVFAAYGLSAALTEQEILAHLAVLNRERVKEEKAGVIRWLRPEFQHPYGTATAVQTELTLVREEAPFLEKSPLPKDHTAQLQAVRSALSTVKGPATADEIAKRFHKARPAKVSALLEDLVKLGLARKEGEKYIA